MFRNVSIDWDREEYTHFHDLSATDVKLQIIDLCHLGFSFLLSSYLGLTYFIELILEESFVELSSQLEKSG